jgi:hypothetical protein
MFKSNKKLEFIPAVQVVTGMKMPIVAGSKLFSEVSSVEIGVVNTIITISTNSIKLEYSNSTKVGVL